MKPGRIAALVVAAAIASTNAWAEPAPATSAATSSAVPLPKIPTPQSIALGVPEPEAVAELDGLLGRLSSMDEAEQQRAAEALANQDATMLPAVAAKLAALRKSADRDAIAKLLEAARKAGRDTKDSSDDADPKPATDTEENLAASDHRLILDPKADWLAFVLAKPSPSQAGWKDLVAILALERVSASIGSTAGAREIVNVYMYFGDLFRIDVQRQLARIGDRSLPALIEAQYHDSKMVRTWAKRRLDVLGKAIPSEAVRTHDTQALADVIRAYGRAREVEAVRPIVGFANSDRLQVREAAREAIGQIGEAARWQLRDAYENLNGHKPAAGWDWKRIAQELFASYDRARLQEVYTTLDQGLALYKEGKLDEAIVQFDRVLARAPMFERRAEMVPAYLDRARTLREKDPSAALAALRRAETLDPTGPNIHAVRAEIAVLEAESLAAKGIVDVTLLEQALQLDPSNARAKLLLDQATRDAEVRQASWRRYAGAGAIGAIALAAMVFIGLGPRKKKEDSAKNDDASPPPTMPPTPDEAPPSR